MENKDWSKGPHSALPLPVLADQQWSELKHIRPQDELLVNNLVTIPVLLTQWEDNSKEHTKSAMSPS